MSRFNCVPFLLVTAVASASQTPAPAYADGPLRSGEIVFSAIEAAGIPTSGWSHGKLNVKSVGAQFVGRMNADGTAVETITTAAGGAFAVADPNTIYAVGWGDDHRRFEVWKVDVRSGAETLIVELDFYEYEWVFDYWTTGYPLWFPFPDALAIEPDTGKILLLVAGPIDGGMNMGPSNILRIDPNAGTTQTPEVLITTNAFGNVYRNELHVGAANEVFVSTVDKLYRLESGALNEFFGPVYVIGGVLDVDLENGDLVFGQGLSGFGQELYRADPNANPMVPTPAVTGTTYMSHGSSIALERDGSILEGLYNASRIERIDVTDGSRQTLLSIGFRVTDLDVVPPACLNGVDDDGDGLIDYRADGSGDPDCVDADDDREVSACSDGYDNDADGLTDTADIVDCPDARSDGEYTLCNNGLDDDGDGEIDGYDSECWNHLDQGELPECSDAIDNDGDNFIDLADALYCQYPHQNCESGNCPDELPACSNGWDDDGDGFIDYDGGPFGGDKDDHCADNPLTVSELPACDDGQDNDGDGVKDFKEDGTGDPDCDARTGTGELPICGDGIDNDVDGLIDFPEDLGCLTLMDPDERPRCSDEIDNDNDGDIDLADSDCRDEEDPTEEPRECSDGIDNDGDGTVDYDGGPAGGTPDPQCNHPEGTKEKATPPGGICSTASAQHTTGLWFFAVLLLAISRHRRRLHPARMARGGVAVAMLLALGSTSFARADGPLVPGEVVLGAPGTAVTRFHPDVPELLESVTVLPADEIKNLVVANRNTVFAVTQHGYESTGGVFKVWSIDVRDGDQTLLASVPATFACTATWRCSYNYLPRLAVEHDGRLLLLVADRFRGSVYRIDPASGPEDNAALVTDQLPFFDGGITIGASIVADTDGTIYVGHWPGLFRIQNGVVESLEPFASVVVGDSLDINRATGALTFMDFVSGVYQADPDGSGMDIVVGVSVPNPTMAREPDGDFVVRGPTEIAHVDGETGDYTVLRSYYGVAPEAVALALSECANGVDDDGDGLIDYRADGSGDPDCVDADDDREVSACSDGYDNDADGLTDTADIVDCPDARSDGEYTLCNNGLDDDGDGEIDGYDSECWNHLDQGELPECSDAIDNDGDSFIDLADALYCQYPHQNCESGNCPAEPPACSNGWDDDGDGFIDYDGGPFGGDKDDHCADNPGTKSELPACDDGIDNDGNGVKDFKEDGTGDPRCDARTGTGELPICGDGIDNDVDGLIDFPEDLGCLTLVDPDERPRCSDEVDNDNDGDVDLADSDCRDEEDPTEEPRECSDGIDNDGDGAIDFDGGPAGGTPDPQCTHPEGTKEKATTPKICSTASAQHTTGLWLLAVLVLAMRRHRRRLHAARLTRGAIALAVAFSLLPPAASAQSENGQGSSQFTGLASAPEANLFSGSMSTSVPIQVPPGRRNATPQLSLAYSSGGGPGPFGYGWSLPLGTIERSTKYGRPRCFGYEQGINHTRDFVAMLSGGSLELIYDTPPDPSKPKIHRYVAKVDESYVAAFLDTRTLTESPQKYNTWVLKDRAGMTYRFGTDSQRDSDPSARMFHRADTVMNEAFVNGQTLLSCEFTSIWALSQMEDSNGNTIDITYFKDENDPGANEIPFSALYPDEIRYGANHAAQCELDSDCSECKNDPYCPDDWREEYAHLKEHPFLIKFVRSPRPTPFEQSHRGVRERYQYIIDRIEVSYRPSLGQPYQLIRAYDLTYVEVNGRMLLVQVDDDSALGGDLVPPQIFTYAASPVDHDEQSTVSVPGGALSETSRRYSPQVYKSVLDVNGDGLPDLVVGSLSGGNWTVYPGTQAGNGGFSGPSFTWVRNGTPSGAIERSCWPAGAGCHEDDEGGSQDITETWYSTMDITGDGIADYINANGTPWQVFPGSCLETAGEIDCQFGTAITWNAPAKFTRRDVKSGSTTTTQRQLMDVNGDGRPDYIYSGEVYINTGSGFDAAPDMSWVGGTVSWSDASSSKVTQQWMDFNGDGLPDFVTGSGSGSTMYVRLNTGRGLGELIELTTPTDANMVSGSKRSGNYTQTYTSFVDVNSDGLPDRVYWLGHYSSWGLGSSGWAVQLNRGGAALESLDAQGNPGVWSTTLGPIRQSLDWNQGGSGVYHNVRGQIDTMDINGDGFVDRVNANGTVDLGKPSGAFAQPFAMLTAHNGIGGFTSVTYGRTDPENHKSADAGRYYDLPFVNWVVKEIRRGDGISPDLVQSIDYAGGLFDPSEFSREFRGFNTVTQTDSDSNQTVTVYGQALYNRGKTLSREQYAGAQLVRRESYQWESMFDTATTRTQVYLAEHKTEEFSLTSDLDHLGQSLDRCVLNRNAEPDWYGRVSHTCSLPCAGAPALPTNKATTCDAAMVGQVDTLTTWANPASGAVDDLDLPHLWERPRYITANYVDPAAQVVTLAHKMFQYDGSGAYGDFTGSVLHGNVKFVRSCIAANSVEVNSTANCTEVADVFNQYDGFGNITQVTDPEGNVSTSEYDHHPNQFGAHTYFSLYPLSEKNALGHEVQTDTDLAIGKPTQKTSANGEVALVSYDALGRPLCEAAPGEDLTNCGAGGPLTHSKEYRYHRGPTGTGFEEKLSYVEVRTREPNAPNGYLVSRQYTDGLGRKRATTTQQVIGSSTSLSTVVAEHIHYGVAGRVLNAYTPYVKTGALVQTPPGQPSTTYDYHLNGSTDIDPQGRAHIVTPPDGKAVKTFFEGRRTRVLSAQGTAHANAAHAIEDDFGRVVRKATYEGANQTPTTWFDNTYDGMGRVLTERVADAEATVVTRNYDLLGRETSLDDPDSGVWAFEYDKNGNVLFRDDPEPDQHVQWIYDALGRVTHVCTFSDDTYVALTTHCSTGTAESTYMYDDVAVPYAVGRLTRVDDLSGFEEFIYDDRGRVAEQTRSIGGTTSTELSGGQASQAIAATMSFVYDAVDRVKNSTYPDGQVITHEYNKAGQPYRLHSSGDYVTSIDYDLLARLDRLVHGNGVEDRRLYFTANTENYRLWKITTSKGSTKHLDLEYAYNGLGKVRQIRDHRDSSTSGNVALSNDADYSYDALGRLTSYDLLRNGSADDVFAYSPIGNITQKGGQTLSYNDPFGPHRVSAYDGKSFTYNENGERTAKGTEAYTYDALGRVTQVVTEGGDTVDYRYDHGGRRTAKRVNSGDWTRFFSSAVESEVDDQGQGWLVKYYFAGDTRVATKREQNNAFVDQASVAPVPFTVPTWVWLLLAGAVGVLFLSPGKRETQLGLTIGPAPAIGAALLMLVISGPAFIALTACHPNPHQQPKPKVEHYHGDHLGSTQVVTNMNGNIDRQVRYEPYGEVRGRFHANGSPVNTDEDKYQHEFTGYETEIESGLQYAGARYFDPEVAQFISHDPERQYASPYAYGPGDPMNGTDPTGRDFGLIALSLIVLGAIAAGVDAYRATGSFSDALKAAGMSLATSIVSAGLFAVIAPVASASVQAVFQVSKATAQLAVKAGMAAYGAYGLSQDIRRGNYASALVGAANLGLSAHGIAKGVQGENTSNPGGYEVGHVDDVRGMLANSLEGGTLSDLPRMEDYTLENAIAAGLERERALMERQSAIDEYGSIMEAAKPGPITALPETVYVAPTETSIFGQLSLVGGIVGAGCFFTGGTACAVAGAFFGVMSIGNSAQQAMNAPTWTDGAKVVGGAVVNRGIGKGMKLPTGRPRVCSRGCTGSTVP